MLFHGLLPLTKLGFTAVDAFVTQYYTKLVSNAFLIWMFWHKFSKYIPYKLISQQNPGIFPDRCGAAGCAHVNAVYIRVQSSSEKKFSQV